MTKEQKARIDHLMDIQGCGCRSGVTREEAEELVELVPGLDMGQDDLHWDVYCLLLDSGFRDLADRLAHKKTTGLIRISSRGTSR